MPGRTDARGHERQRVPVLRSAVRVRRQPSGEPDATRRARPRCPRASRRAAESRRTTSRSASRCDPLYAGRTRQPELLERSASLLVVSEQRDPVQRAGASRSPQSETVSRRRMRAPAVVVAAREVRMVEAQALSREERAPAALGVELVEDSVDQLLVPDEAPARARAARSCDERERREPVAQRENSSPRRAPRRRCRGSRRPRSRRRAPGSSEAPAREASACSRVRVGPRRADAEARPALPHQVGHVELRRQSDLEARRSACARASRPAADQTRS